MSSSDALPIPRKNVAYRVAFPGLKSDGSLITTGTGMDSEVSKDQGTFVDCTNEATEIATTSGIYYLDLTSAEMDADMVVVKCTWTNSLALTTVLALYPQEADDIRVNPTYWNGGAIPAVTVTGVPKVDVADWLGVAPNALMRGKVDAANALYSATATAGGALNITFPAGASAIDTFYRSSLIQIVGGTGIGQARFILDYNGTTKIATVHRAWLTNPDATSVFVVVPWADLGTSMGIAQGGGASTITLNAGASPTDDLYVGLTIFLQQSTGAGQSRIITAYNGTTKVATVASAWVTQPTSTTEYVLYPEGRVIVVQNNDKTGYALSTAGAQAVWTATTRALTSMDFDVNLAMSSIQALWDYNVENLSTPESIGAFLLTLAAIKTKTDQLIFTVANKLDANITAIVGSTTRAALFAAMVDGGISAVATGAPTTTTMPASGLPSTHDNQYSLPEPSYIVWTSGVLVGVKSKISAYNTTTKVLTFDAVHTAPTAGDAFVIV